MMEIRPLYERQMMLYKHSFDSGDNELISDAGKGVIRTAELTQRLAAIWLLWCNSHLITV